MGNVTDPSSHAQCKDVAKDSKQTIQTEDVTAPVHGRVIDQDSSTARHRPCRHGKADFLSSFHPEIQDSSSEEEQDIKEICKKRQNRVLRIVKNIIGEKNIDFNQEQILMGIISNEHNEIPEDKLAKAHLQHLQEEYSKRMKDKENIGYNYMYKMVREMYAQRDVSVSQSRDLFKKITEGSSKLSSRRELFKEFSEGSTNNI